MRPEESIIELTSDDLRVQIVPEAGGAILSLVSLGKDIDLLWKAPWVGGSIPRPQPSDPAGEFFSIYPGGWQTIFPSGGDACTYLGVDHPFHGEASVAPWRVDSQDRTSVSMFLSLGSLPFDLVKTVSVERGAVHVVERATNLSDNHWEVMWSHHPAFGPPFLSEHLTLDIPATRFIADDERDVPGGLRPGLESRWPSSETNTGAGVDLSKMPSARERSDRFGYISGLADGSATLTNPDVGLEATIRWDKSLLPHAWYWLEAHSTSGYPWFGDAYVLAIEPASTFPGQGLARAIAKGGKPVRFAPRRSRTLSVSLEVRELA